MNTALITAEQLQAQIGKGVVVIECRFNLMDKNQGIQQYRAGHIPGAFYFHLDHDLSAPVAQHGGRHPLPGSEVLADKLRRAGLCGIEARLYPGSWSDWCSYQEVN